MWKVARYTSAAPMYFTEFENYVDGGVLANNPCDVGLTAIQNYRRTSGVFRPITLVVSIGSGLCSGMQLGSTNVQEYFLLGKHWLNPEGFKERVKNLLQLVGNAVRHVDKMYRGIFLFACCPPVLMCVGMCVGMCIVDQCH